MDGITCVLLVEIEHRTRKCLISIIYNSKSTQDLYLQSRVHTGNQTVLRKKNMTILGKMSLAAILEKRRKKKKKKRKKERKKRPPSFFLLPNVAWSVFRKCIVYTLHACY